MLLFITVDIICDDLRNPECPKIGSMKKKSDKKNLRNYYQSEKISQVTILPTRRFLLIITLSILKLFDAKIRLLKIFVTNGFQNIAPLK